MNSNDTDVKPSARWWTLVAALLVVFVGLGFVVSGDNPVTRADADVVAWVVDHRPDWLAETARAVTRTGHGALLAAILVAVCAGLALRGVVPWRAALLPPIALAVGGGLNPLLKAIVERPRPPLELRAVVESSSGFPSGHSTQSACAWIALGLVLWLWGRGHPRWPLAVAMALAATIGITRVVLGVHSPTDLLAGWAWGSAVALIVVGVAATAERSRARPSPRRAGDGTAPPRAADRSEIDP